MVDLKLKEFLVSIQLYFRFTWKSDGSNLNKNLTIVLFFLQTFLKKILNLNRAIIYFSTSNSIQTLTDPPFFNIFACLHELPAV